MELKVVLPLEELLEALADDVARKVRGQAGAITVDPVVSVRDYAEEHKIGRSAVSGRVKRGELPAPRKILGTRGWYRSELETWARRRGGSQG